MPYDHELTDEEEFERYLDGVVKNDASFGNVDLNDIEIGESGARRLAKALRGTRTRGGNTFVTRLSFRCCFIGKAGVRALVKALEDNSSVGVLDLFGNTVDDDVAMALAQMLLINSTLHTLDLGGTHIGTKGMEALARMLRVNSTLHTLDVCGNGIGTEGIRALARALRVNSSLKKLDVSDSNMSDEAAQAFVEALYSNTSIISVDVLNIYEQTISIDLYRKLQKLVRCNADAPNPQEARRRKVECRIEWLLEESDSAEDAREAVALTLDELDNFPIAERRRGLFQALLGSPDHGTTAANSVDVATARTLYWYAAECGAAPNTLMTLMRAHPSLCECRDVRHHLYPFMLLATLPEAGVGDVMELLLMKPDLIKGGIARPVERRSKRKAEDL